MIKLTINNIKNGKSWIPEVENIKLSEYKTEHIQKNSWGKPQRWVLAKYTDDGVEISPEEDYSEDEVISSARIKKVIKTQVINGEITNTEVDVTRMLADQTEVPVYEVELKAEYTIVEEDLTFSKLQEKLLEDLDDKWDKEKLKGVKYGDYLVQSDDKAKGNLTSAAVNFIMFQVLESGWVSEYKEVDDTENPGQKKKLKNQKVPINNEADFRNVAQVIAGDWKTKFWKRNEVRKLIEEATLVTELEAINIDTEWENATP
jgi:hypothetical protein